MASKKQHKGKAQQRRGKQVRRKGTAIALDDQDPRKILQPKLRMIINGSAGVNVLRAEHNSALMVEGRLATDPKRLGAAEVVKPKHKARAKLHRQRKATMVSAHVFIDFKDQSGTPKTLPRVQQIARHGRQVAALVRLTDLEWLARNPAIARVELAEALNDPRPTVDPATVPEPRRRDFGPAAWHQDGARVLIGIIDVGGFDFAHPDFLKPNGETRFHSIWDQGGTTRPRPPGFRFDYGSLIDAAAMNRAMRKSAAAGAPATELEPQSQMVVGSHGTHVASIAAGKTGVCPKALIAGVLISMGPDDQDIRKSFYDSTRVIHAVQYLIALADELRLPVSINISLGTNGHAHDGSSPTSRWLDAMLTTPGRSICVATGNAGQEGPEHEGDLGWLSGRIHTSGRIAGPGLAREVEWCVVGDGFADVSENELEVWYAAQDRLKVTVRNPGGEWSPEVGPGEYIENHPIYNGTFLSVYNEPYHHANGANYISVYLSPPLDQDRPTAGVSPGVWTVRLTGVDIRDGGYHGWIERDDPRPTGIVKDGAQFWNFPSFFFGSSNVDRYSVSSLACGHNVVAVANLDEPNRRVSISSSQGPTRDERHKPDVCAPGTDIVAAKGFAGPDDLWIGMTGTSMASPYAAGVIGLMLSAKPTLTAPQVLSLLRRTAQPLPGTDYVWRDGAGYGVIMPVKAVEEARGVGKRHEVRP